MNILYKHWIKTWCNMKWVAGEHRPEASVTLPLLLVVLVLLSSSSLFTATAGGKSCDNRREHQATGQHNVSI